MAVVTLKSLHSYLKLLENPSELKRRMPASSNPRALKEGLYETSRLVGVDEAVFKDPEHVAALIGAQRFVMIWGEPSVTDHVARVFDSSRVLFEHMLGFASQSSALQGGVSLVNDLTGSREHSRSFLSTALFVLGTEIDRDNLISFMMQQGLFGMPIFEHLLQNRDYCDAFHAFRRLERAFMGSPEAEEAQLRKRLDQLNAQFGGKPCGGKIFEADEQDKAKIDAYLAATDLLEVMALTPWCMSLNKAVSLASSNSIRSVSTIARHFECLGKGERTNDQVNKAIADHLLAFARQFSADNKPA